MAMYARLSKYVFRIEAPQRWAAVRERGDEPPAIEMLASLNGCRGVWVMSPENDSQSTEVRYTIFSLWDTQDQAGSVVEHIATQLQQAIDDWGLSVAKPPQTEIASVEGRAL
jgi:hypothetical protein